MGIRFSLKATVCFTRGVRGCGLPRRFAPRNDNLFFTLLCLFPSAQDSAPETPSALRATVSLRRRCTTLKGAALRGKGFGLARWVRRSARRGSENGVAVATPFYLLYNIILLWCRP